MAKLKKAGARTLLFISILFSALAANADVRLPKLISDNMVLQRDLKLKIWGWGTPGEKVVVRIDGRKAGAVTGSDGKWMAVLAPMKAGGPFTMTVTGKNTIKLSNVLIGDVWFVPVNPIWYCRWSG